METNRAWYILYTLPGGEAEFRAELINRLNEAGLGDRLLDFIIPDVTKRDFSLLRSLTDETAL